MSNFFRVKEILATGGLSVPLRVVIALLYFLITFAIMGVSILLIYRAACFFGLQVDRWALILCAVMAVGVNFASIYLSDILTLDHLMVVIVLVLVSAALMTLFNEYLLRRHAPVLAGADGSLSEDVVFAEDEAGAEASDALLAVTVAEAGRLSARGQDAALCAGKKKARRRKTKTLAGGAVTEVVGGGHAGAEEGPAQPKGASRSEKAAAQSAAAGAGGSAPEANDSAKTPASAPAAQVLLVARADRIEAAAPEESAASREAPSEPEAADAATRPDGRTAAPLAASHGDGGLPETGEAPSHLSRAVPPVAVAVAVPPAPEDADTPATAGSAPAAPEGAAGGDTSRPRPLGGLPPQGPGTAFPWETAATLANTAFPTRVAGKSRSLKGPYGGKRRPAAKGLTGAGRASPTKGTRSSVSRSPFGKGRGAPPKAPPIGLELARLRTLDDYLDYASKKRAAGCTADAILTYQQALGKFRDDSYVPFLVIELGNMYKELGDYAEAISAYRSTLRLSAVKRQAGMAEAFRENIAYLDAVLSVLSRRRMPNTPFSQIPPDCRGEIERRFTARWAEQNTNAQEAHLND